MEAELRFFVAKHLWKVAGLLSTAKRVFPETAKEAIGKATSPTRR